MRDPVGRRETLLALATVIGGALLLWLQARRFLPFFADDAFISLRYADRLLEGKGLTWTDGERVEGYSNLLWVLLVAGIARLGSGDLIAAARALGCAGAVATLGAVAFSHGARPRAERVAPIAGVLVLAVSTPLAVWAIGGMEQGLVAGLLAWAIALAMVLATPTAEPRVRSYLVASVPAALLCLTRPDGVLFALALALALVVSRARGASSVKSALAFLVLPSLLTAGQVAFRLFYYGEWLPNTAHAKLAFSIVRLEDGLRYLTNGARALPFLPLLLVAAAGLLFTQARARAVLLLGVAVPWIVYVALIGGDILPAHRHLVPVIVVAAFAAAEATAWLGRRAHVGAWSIVALFAIPLLAWPQAREAEIRRARDKLWEWDGKVVGEVLGRAFARERPLLAVDPAGCLPFFSRLPSLDMLGLNDRFLATHPPATLGRGPLGHELGDGAYVLSRKPDLIVFCGPAGSETPCFPSGREMVAAPELHADYQLVRLEIADMGTLTGFPSPPAMGPAGQSPSGSHATRMLQSLIWFRREGRIGIRREDGGETIRVPGFLLSSDRETLTRVAGDGQLYARATDGHPARLARLGLGTGAWRLSARTDAPARLKVKLDRTPTTPALEGPGAVTFALAAPAAIDVEVGAPPGEERAILEVVARRTREGAGARP